MTIVPPPPRPLCIYEVEQYTMMRNVMGKIITSLKITLSKSIKRIEK
jgi:hypothetical protein